MKSMRRFFFWKRKVWEGDSTKNLPAVTILKAIISSVEVIRLDREGFQLFDWTSGLKLPTSFLVTRSLVPALWYPVAGDYLVTTRQSSNSLWVQVRRGSGNPRRRRAGAVTCSISFFLWIVCFESRTAEKNHRNSYKLSRGRHAEQVLRAELPAISDSLSPRNVFNGFRISERGKEKSRTRKNIFTSILWLSCLRRLWQQRGWGQNQESRFGSRRPMTLTTGSKAARWAGTRWA